MKCLFKKNIIKRVYLARAILIPLVSAKRYLPLKNPTDGQYPPAQTWIPIRMIKIMNGDEIIVERKNATEDAPRIIWNIVSFE